MNYLIIGAGFSGLAAAGVLHRAGKKFLVLEARNRPGGRVHTLRYEDNRYLDLGGQWIGPGQHRMYELAAEHNLEWFSTYNSGKNIIDLKNTIRTYTGLIPEIDLPSLINIQFVISLLERHASKIQTEAPWQHPNALQYDSLTLEYFIRKHCLTRNAYQVVRTGLETVFACKPNEISLLHALFYIKSGNSLNTLLSIENGAQQHRIKGGMQQLAERMAQPFQEQIRYNQAVKSIVQDENKVVVSGENFSYLANRVIVAIPPVLIRQIYFEPALPLTKRQLLQKLSMGHVGKVFGVYPGPFWRKSGFSGQVVTDDKQPFQVLFDSSPADGRYGVLLAFCIADRAQYFFSLGEEQRKNLALQIFARYFGAQALQPDYYTDHCWADEMWSKGCYAAIYPTGTWTSFRNELSKPFHHIHWAGTETATEWYGYIEGAVRAGERAAAEILSAE